MTGGELVDLWRRAVSTVKAARIEAGLSDREIDLAEAAYRLTFPVDLRECLQAALPTAPDVGREQRCQFPSWRDLTDPGIVLRLSGPWEGWVFDLEHEAHGAWLPQWGSQPEELPQRIAAARVRYDLAPTLVPVFGHRYMPSDPTEAGSPVFSVHQMDIIHYGFDLEDYLHVEFLGRKHGTRWPGEPRRIPFWSDIVEYNDARP